TGTWTALLTGVGTRTVSGTSIPTSVWTYSSSLSNVPAYVYCENQFNVLVLRAAPSEEVTVTATDPICNVTDTYSSGWPVPSGTNLYDAGGNLLNTNGNSPNGFNVAEYGLPLTHMASSGGRFLSRHVYTHDGYAANPKQPLRSVYVSYERDSTSCGVVDF